MKKINHWINGKNVAGAQKALGKECGDDSNR